MFNLIVVVLLYPIILCNKPRRNVKCSIICMSCYILRLSDLILLLTSTPSVNPSFLSFYPPPFISEAQQEIGLKSWRTSIIILFMEKWKLASMTL